MRRLRNLSCILALITMGAVLSGCVAGHGGYFTPTVSTAAAGLSPAAAAAIAGDMTAKLAEHVGPGTGTIALRSDETPFARAFEQSLRGWGYAVHVGPNQGDQDLDAIPLAYAIDLADGFVMARISTPVVEITRSYTLSETGALPASPVSVLRSEPN